MGQSRRILVTGAAGLIGSELCGQLVERGHSVIALVHRRRELVRNNRQVIRPSAYAGAPSDRGTVQWLAGDIRKPGLGLDDRTAASLVGGVGLIVHCAAETKFSPTRDLHHSVNVAGTHNVISFARGFGSSAPGLVYISTAYVSGERSGPIAEEELDAGQRFANSYEASKAGAEKLVRTSSLRAAIARPSIVLGRSDTGAIGRFDALYAFLRLIASGRITLLPATPDATLDLVPIDHVIGGLIDIIEHFEMAAGKTFHLVSGDPAPVAALISLDYAGLDVPRVVRPEWFDPRLLRPTERALYCSVTSAYSAYLRRNPRFLARNLPALSGRVCPPTGHAFLRRALGYATAAGYLKPAATRLPDQELAYRTSG
jgi:nucleoside-diphosphate-sugar epimerase